VLATAGKEKKRWGISKSEIPVEFFNGQIRIANMPSRYTQYFVLVLYANKRHIKLRKINLWISPQENHLSDT
jgi:hypothetical protein